MSVTEAEELELDVENMAQIESEDRVDHHRRPKRFVPSDAPVKDLVHSATSSTNATLAWTILFVLLVLAVMIMGLLWVTVNLSTRVNQLMCSVYVNSTSC